MMSNSIERGKAHAPGVDCIVAVTPTFFGVKTHAFHFPNNGKIVKIIRKLNTHVRYVCRCGCTIGPEHRDCGVFWEASGEDLTCRNGVTNIRPFHQSWLIPIGDSSLLLPEINAVIKEQTKEIIKPYREPIEKEFADFKPYPIPVIRSNHGKDQATGTQEVRCFWKSRA